MTEVTTQLQFQLGNWPDSRNMETFNNEPDVIIIEKLSNEDSCKSTLNEAVGDNVSDTFSYVDKTKLKHAITLARRDLRNKKIKEHSMENSSNTELCKRPSATNKVSKSSSKKGMKVGNVDPQQLKKVSSSRNPKILNSHHKVLSSNCSSRTKLIDEDGSHTLEGDNHNKLEKVLDNLARLHCQMDQQLEEMESSLKKALNKLNLHETIPMPKEMGSMSSGNLEDHTRVRLRIDEQMIRLTRTRYFLQRQSHNIERDWMVLSRTNSISTTERCKIGNRLTVVFREALQCATMQQAAIYHLALSNAALLESEDLLSMLNHVIRLRLKVDDSLTCRNCVDETKKLLDSINSLTESLQIRIKELTAPKRKRKNSSKRSATNLLKNTNVINNVASKHKVSDASIAVGKKLTASNIHKYIENNIGKRYFVGRPLSLHQPRQRSIVEHHTHNCQPSKSVPPIERPPPRLPISPLVQRPKKRPSKNVKADDISEHGSLKSCSISDFRSSCKSSESQILSEDDKEKQMSSEDPDYKVINDCSKVTESEIEDKFHQLQIFEEASDRSCCALSEPILDTLLELLNYMQKEQEEIHAKWNSVSFPAIHGDGKHIKNEPIVDNVPQPILMTNVSESQTSLKRTSLPPLSPHDQKFFSRHSSVPAFSKPAKLRLPDDVKSSLVKNVEEFSKYRNEAFPTLDGYRDISEFANEISEELLNSCIEAVATEVETLNSDIVEHICQSEFTLPHETF